MMKVNLKVAKELIEANTEVKVRIERIYIDYGANWVDDNLVVYGKDGDSYQLLCPMHVMAVKHGLLTIEDVQEYIDDINKRGW